jgi:hypothetical protein
MMEFDARTVENDNIGVGKIGGKKGFSSLLRGVNIELIRLIDSCRIGSIVL